MARPNLIHKVRCVYRSAAVDLSDMDVDAREAIQIVDYGRETNITGQPNFQSLGEDADYTHGGVRVETNGYILLRYADLRVQHIDLKIGDRFVQVGHLRVDIYVERLEPTGHYPDQNGASLVKAHCRDRNPSRNTKGEVC